MRAQSVSGCVAGAVDCRAYESVCRQLSDSLLRARADYRLAGVVVCAYVRIVVCDDDWLQLLTRARRICARYAGGSDRARARVG